jgi:phytoene dehydrogenase-like protein
VRDLESSISAMVLSLGVNRDLREVGLGAFNIWDYPSIDIDALYDPIFHGRLPDKPGMFISANSLKDPTGQMAPRGKTSLEVVTLAPYSIFGAWANVPAEERGDDFHLLKDRLRDQLLEQLDARLPGVVEHVEVMDFSTPLAMEGWVNLIDGGLYGPAMTPDQSVFFRFPSSTFLHNLFLAGAGVFGDGVLPCMQSGQVAAKMVERALSKSSAASLR